MVKQRQCSWLLKDRSFHDFVISCL
uniref:Uncharacterized protein n=1 Tax=Rhizophora mucronata TaxID=61149 RepID=A0A2P2QVN5_RHIMU